MIGQHKPYEKAASFRGTCKSSAIIIMNYETTTLALMEAARGPHTPTAPVTGTQATNWQMMIKCREPDPTVDSKRLTQTQTQLDSTTCCKHIFLTGLGLDSGKSAVPAFYMENLIKAFAAPTETDVYCHPVNAQRHDHQGVAERRVDPPIRYIHHYYNKCFHLISLKWTQNFPSLTWFMCCPKVSLTRF